MNTTLCYIDTETTGLNPRIHQPYEVCLWREGVGPATYRLPHTLEHADIAGLNISRYFERDMFPFQPTIRSEVDKDVILQSLHNVTLVGSNPSFDANMMLNYLGVAVWHHRFINVSDVAMTVFDWDRPKGLFDVAKHLRTQGWEIPEPDHTAEGDVRVTKRVYEALRDIRLNDMHLEPA